MLEGAELVFVSASSDDYPLAEKVHDFLRGHGVEVFFAARSLVQLGDSDYRRVIDTMLDKCVHMVVVGSTKARIESPWVEAEWGFFVNAKRAGAKRGNIVTVTAGGLEPVALPPSLRYHEVLPLSETGLRSLLGYVAPLAAKAERPASADRAHGMPEIEGLHGGARLRVFGIGRGGQRVMDFLSDSPPEDVGRVAVGTDAPTLARCRAEVRLLVGEGDQRGLGAGGDPGPARELALAETAKLEREVEGCDLVLLAAGLGGVTGTGVAPVLAQLARDRGILVVAVVTLPFRFEGPRRAQLAEETLRELTSICDAVVALPADETLAGLAPACPVPRAFEQLSALSARCVRALGRLFQNRGLVNLDFADMAAVLQRSGIAAMGAGEATGREAAATAVRAAMTTGYVSSHPLRRARTVAMLLEGGPGLRLDDLAGAAEVLRPGLDPDAVLVFGSEQDDALGEAVRVTLIAARFAETG